MTSNGAKGTSPTYNSTTSRFDSLSTSVSQSYRTLRVLSEMRSNATTSEQPHIPTQEPAIFTELPRSESSQIRDESLSTSVPQSDKTVTSNALPQVPYSATTSEQPHNPTKEPDSFTKLPSSEPTQTRVSTDINRSRLAVNETKQLRLRDDTVHATNCHNVSLSDAKSTNQSGGVFDVRVAGLGVIEIYCDVKTDGGRWNVSVV